jgi:hypothetical protein
VLHVPLQRTRRVGWGCGGNRNKIGRFEGSETVLASPSGRGEACMRDLFNFNF